MYPRVHQRGLSEQQRRLAQEQAGKLGLSELCRSEHPGYIEWWQFDHASPRQNYCRPEQLVVHWQFLHVVTIAHRPHMWIRK